MPRGNAKGSNGGGGRIKGQRRGETKEQTLARQAAEAAETLARAKALAPKQSKDILSQAMNYYFSLAALYQPGDTNHRGDEKKFELYLDKAADIAAKLAPYQHRRLASLQVTPMPLDLSKLTDAQLVVFEQLYTAALPGGDTGGEVPTLQ